MVVRQNSVSRRKPASSRDFTRILDRRVARSHGDYLYWHRTFSVPGRIDSWSSRYKTYLSCRALLESVAGPGGQGLEAREYELR